MQYIKDVNKPKTVNKDGRHDSSLKVKPNHPDCHLVAGCSMGHKSNILRVSGWNMD